MANRIQQIFGAISASATGTSDITVSGFGTVKACLLFFRGGNNIENALSIGISDFTSHFCIVYQDEDGSAKVDCDSMKSNTAAYIGLDNAGVVEYSGTVSVITDGVRLTNTVNTLGVPRNILVVLIGGGDVSVSIDSITIPSTTGNTQVVTTGIDQDVVFFIGVDIAGEDSANTGINNSFGIAHINAAHDAFVNRCLGWASDHNASDGAPAAVIRSNRCLKILTETGGDDWGIELTAASATSYTITTRDVGAGANMECYALAIDFGAAATKIGSVDSPTSGSIWTPSVSLGFTPEFVSIYCTQITAEDIIEANADGGSLGFSFNNGEDDNTFLNCTNQDGGFLGNSRTRATYKVAGDVTLFFVADNSDLIQHHTHNQFISGGWSYAIVVENETTARKYFYLAVEDIAIPDEGVPGINMLLGVGT